MSDFFLGQIMMTGFNFAPRSWALADGQPLSIAQNSALFSLLGTQFGGNGQTTFALPDLRGRTPVGYGASADPGWQPAQVQIGEAGGVENVTLVQSELPSHQHTVSGSSARATSADPTGRTFAVRRSGNGFASSSAFGLSGAAGFAVGTAGSSQPHPNMQPYAVINFCVALQGIFPPRN